MLPPKPLLERQQSEEWERIHERRQVAFGAIYKSAKTDKRPKNLTGLALSGGGLRSALFNEGLLQSLSHRGLLRYVDLLCSVSGGGYIAGRLMTYAKKRAVAVAGSDSTPGAQPEPTGNCDAAQLRNQAPAATIADSFHDSASPVQDWHLGRDPYTGKEKNEMPQVGNYLSQTVSFTVLYILRQIPIWMLYLSLTGIMATLLALYFRTFDNRLYRDVTFTLIGMEFGNELLVAFLPTLLVAGITLLLAALYWAAELARLQTSSLLKGVLGAIQFGVIATCVLALTSTAIFLGNDLTAVSANSNGNFNLNYFATTLGLLAAMTQILVFIGRDRLLKSENSEAAHWQKVLQGVVSYGVATLMFFSMIHFMGRENISNYIEHRDPHLVSGDVLNWKLLRNIDPSHQQGPDPDLASWAKSELHGPSDARKYWHDNFSIEHSQPPSPFEDESVSKYSNLQRGWYYLATSFSPRSLWTQLAGEPLAFDAAELSEAVERPGVLGFNLYRIAATFHQHQEQYLKLFNEKMNGQALANRLVTMLLNSSKDELPSTGNVPAKPLAARMLGIKRIEQRLERWPKSRRDSFLAAITQHDLGSLSEEFGSSASYAALNRDLLELALPGLLREKHIASTHVVQYHDQQARGRWLCIWSVLFAVALVFTANRNGLIAFFIFYRSALSRYFLVRAHAQVNGETRIADLCPEARGLPLPIYLASWLKLDNRFGNFFRSPRALAVSPCGIRLKDVGEPSVELWSRSACATTENQRLQDIKLADAVAISGSAVTPQMTQNVALSLIMDFFGMRLGMWLDHPGAIAKKRNVIDGLILASAIASTITFAAALVMNALTIAWVSLPVAVFAYMAYFSVGYPSILVSIVRQHSLSLIKHSSNADDADDADRAISNCWPKIFVADGGFSDFLGVTELIDRRCELIIVSDAGVNSGQTTLESLARMCEKASKDQGVRFMDLDHDSPIDFARLRKNDSQLTPQPYIAMRIIYPRAGSEIADNGDVGTAANSEGLLFYAQMAITEDDPIEIQQIRYRFPSFPDEPTTNQFYTEEQVSAYRHLGYHIGNRLCRLLERWSQAEIRRTLATQEKDRIAVLHEGEQPLFGELRRRLIRGYLQTCYEEYFYETDDVHGESVWRNHTTAALSYPSLATAAGQLMPIVKQVVDRGDTDDHALCDWWLSKYLTNRDVSIRYMDAIDHDINKLELAGDEFEDPDEKCDCYALFRQLTKRNQSELLKLHFADERLLPAHYAVLAIAAQQLHRGVSHTIFQVGGREKLVHLMCSLQDSCDDQFERVGAGKVNSAADFATSIARAIVHEVSELNTCVFQSAEQLAVVSFVHCLCLQIPHIYPLQSLVKDEGAANGDNGLRTINTKGKFDVRYDFRRLLLDGLDAGYPSHTLEIIAKFLECQIVNTSASPYSPKVSPILTRTVTASRRAML